ncbi:plasmid pRiA4b ORF-3 family protein [Fimbriiglobus ruber]|uniref:Plasmid pRiA4b Orf3-like domain-containing protein n=1 Tax=Fimbriiglobus ruber TaxID=1908690 RepID=A0A225DM00_9BACT|nr:plasmid pRiA4b ORF-3 family protein [Fimbriiglobus ruber]OWK38506.1 hypothetical protein FRUB_07626 [Fimbriiglobus ruber]
MPRKKVPGLPSGQPDTAGKSAAPVYRLKISLDDSKPPIWRRVEVKDCDLETLHGIIQAVMPWSSYHLWVFFVNRDEEYGPASDEFEPIGEPAHTAFLSQFVARGLKKIRYNYDFGDSWDHTVTFEKTIPAEAGVAYPRCTAGVRACPPEDCGGIGGYYRLLEILADPNHPEHKVMLEWTGGPIDPEAFDLAATDAALAPFRA